jgi:light-regulated signal transduction histidine kinase (bacteriophytochrome)
MSDRAQLEAAYEELVMIAYSAAEELRSPLRLVHGLANAMQENGFREEAPTCTQMIVESTRHMQRLVDNFTSFLLVQRVVAQHGGHIAERDAGDKDTFHFTVPALSGDEHHA